MSQQDDLRSCPLPNVADGSIRPPPTALGEVTKLRELVDPEDRIVEEQGWRVLRFSNEEVIEDVEAIAIAIAKSMGLKPTYGPHIEVRSGMRSRRSPNSKKGRERHLSQQSWGRSERA
jgi:hypothetical protein